jgi:hypothetical protein
MKKSLLDLWCGISRHPLKTLGYIFTQFSIFFTLVKVVNHFFPSIDTASANILLILLVASICLALWKMWKPSKIEMKMQNSNTTIEIIFGDLFEQDGIRAIAVNEFFDSKIGKPVSDKSLHGIFLQKCFGGYPQPFDNQLDDELKLIKSNPVVRNEGKTEQFPIGTTAMINCNQDQYLVFALSKTDSNTCKASSDVNMMWLALHKLWNRMRIEAGGHAVNIPLIGSGLSGLGLPTRDLLNLIILSAITETKSKEITQRIRIVLHSSRFDDLDLRDVKKHWEEK